MKLETFSSLAKIYPDRDLDSNCFQKEGCMLQNEAFSFQVAFKIDDNDIQVKTAIGCKIDIPDELKPYTMTFLYFNNDDKYLVELREKSTDYLPNENLLRSKNFVPLVYLKVRNFSCELLRLKFSCKYGRFGTKKSRRI